MQKFCLNPYSNGCVGECLDVYTGMTLLGLNPYSNGCVGEKIGKTGKAFFFMS